MSDAVLVEHVDGISVITINRPEARNAINNAVAVAMDWTLEEGFREQLPIVQPVLGSADAREGATAFAEKRSPVWQGR